MNDRTINPPAIVKQAEEDLPALAKAANQTHGAVEEAARASLEQARDAGQLLLRAKKAVGHGKWGKWLEKNIKFSARTARAYMRVADEWEAIEAKMATVANLTYREALRLLVEEAPADAEDGPAAPPPPRFHDEAKQPVPKVAEPAFERVPEIRRRRDQINELIKAVEEEGKGPAGAHLHSQSIATHLANAKNGLWQGRPAYVCPYCKGEKASCKACKGQGWVNPRLYDNAPPELKAGHEANGRADTED